MKIQARVLLVLHGDAAFHERLRSAVRRRYEYRPVPDWESLRAAVREAPPSAVVLVDPYLGEAGDQVSREIRVLGSDFPSIPMLAALQVGPDDALVLVELGASGVCDVISIGHDDTPVALLYRLDRAEGRPLQMLMEHALPVEVAGRARAIIHAATKVVSSGANGRTLASMLGVSRRTLLRWCEAAALPPPRRLLAWMRILLAAELLDDRGRTVRGVAQACGYSSDGGLRRVTLSFVGHGPTELRSRGAFAGASRRFLAELQELREQTHSPAGQRVRAALG